MSRRVLFALLASLAVTSPAFAHDGPPYPIAVDEPIGPWELSVWADPDVGTGTFYFYLESSAATSLPGIRLAVRPLDVERAESSFETITADENAPYDLFAEVDFSHRGPWQVRVLVDAEQGRGELDLNVEVTPPGLGKIDLLWYLSPFLAVGALWVKVMLARRTTVTSQEGTT